ncbi:MAG: hypothetical protein KGL75_08700, partial [Acidobacteriota bacterium]|nr:hypothetical protein [Acidobacteriota bacterium]
MKPKKTDIAIKRLEEARPVPIVADAAISTVGVHGGRMLPVLLLDCSARPEIAELIRVHDALGPCDVVSQWGQVPGHQSTVALFLT